MTYDEMTPEQLAAYDAARAEIAQAKADGTTELEPTGGDHENLVTLPPEIGELSALRELDLSQLPLTDLTPLAGLAALQSLNLFSTQVTDLTPLAGLSALQTLDLRKSQVTDLSPLAGLSALKQLELSYSQVTDLSPLAGLSALQGLYLSNTQVTDLAPLAGLSTLQSLNLDGTRVTDLRPLLALDLIRDNAGEDGSDDPPWAILFQSTPATESDPTLKDLSEIEDDKERAKKTRAYLQTLPPYPEPLPWESARELTAPEQVSALELVWTSDGFGFNTQPVPVAEDPVAQATLEDLRDVLNELIRLTGNQHEDIYRRAEQLRDRITCDAIDLLKAHLAFQRLQRLYDQRGDRTAPLDDETNQTLQDVVETLPGLTLADPKVKDLLDRQAANRRDRADAAQVDAEIEIAKAMSAEGAPFDAEVKQVAEDGATDAVDDQLTRVRPTLVKNAVIAVGREFQSSPIRTLASGAALAGITVTYVAPWLALNAEPILLAAAHWGQEYLGWISPIIDKAKAAVAGAKNTKDKLIKR